VVCLEQLEHRWQGLFFDMVGLLSVIARKMVTTIGRAFIGVQ
jgi:hypothetical protein